MCVCFYRGSDSGVNGNISLLLKPKMGILVSVPEFLLVVLPEQSHTKTSGEPITA
jgi:hypothetical protein